MTIPEDLHVGDKFIHTDPDEISVVLPVCVKSILSSLTSVL